MLKDSFCSSPWIHIRLRYDGSYKVCRWSTDSATNYNIRDYSILEFYNSEVMKNLRLDLLNGQQPQGCKNCYYQESFGKIPGRQKQLLKSAVSKYDFDLTMRASPHYEMFKHSYENNGVSNYHPVDFQIDLGNYCNSACIMCGPESSSRLEKDYLKLNQLEPTLFNQPKKYTSWTRDPALVDKFVLELKDLPNLGYIHLLGGETLYDPAFYAICDRLIELDLAKNIILGTTTNGTIYNNKLAKIIPEFKQFHLGISIESVTELNDYVRWPGKIGSILENIQKFKQLESHSNLFNSLRITPNLFTIYEFDQLAEYMIENNLTAESCNVLYNPAQLKIEIMPDDIRRETLEKFNNLIDRYQLTEDPNNINIREASRSFQTISNVIIEYRNFVRDYTVPSNVEDLRHQLVKFLKAFEHSRNNRITDYAPRFTDFLRRYGY